MEESKTVAMIFAASSKEKAINEVIYKKVFMDDRPESNFSEQHDKVKNNQ